MAKNPEEEDDEVIFLSEDDEDEDDGDEEEEEGVSNDNIPLATNRTNDNNNRATNSRTNTTAGSVNDNSTTEAVQSPPPPVKIKRKRNATTRKSISLNMKLEILDRLRNGEGPTKIARSYGWNESTIRTIKKNETIIRQSVTAGSLLTSRYSSYTRDGIMEAMEQRLLEWIETHNKRIDDLLISQQGVRSQDINSHTVLRPLDSAAVRLKAVNIYNELKNQRKLSLKQMQRNRPKYGVNAAKSKHSEPDPNDSSGGTDTWNFAASKGWFGNFRRRYSLNSNMRRDPNCSSPVESPPTTAPLTVTSNSRVVVPGSSLTCSVVVPVEDYHPKRKYRHVTNYLQRQYNNNPDLEDEFSIKVAKIIQQNACKQLQQQRSNYNNSGTSKLEPPMVEHSILGPLRSKTTIVVGDHNNNHHEMDDNPVKHHREHCDDNADNDSSSGDIEHCSGQQLVVDEDNQFTADNVGSVLQLAITLKKFILQIDPDCARANRFCQNLQHCLEPYQQVYQRLDGHKDDIDDSHLQTTSNNKLHNMEHTNTTKTSKQLRQDDNGDGLVVVVSKPNHQDDHSSSAQLFSGPAASPEPSANEMTSSSSDSSSAATSGKAQQSNTVRLKSSDSSSSMSSSTSSSASSSPSHHHLQPPQPYSVLFDKRLIQIGNRLVRTGFRPKPQQKQIVTGGGGVVSLRSAHNFSRKLSSHHHSAGHSKQRGRTKFTEKNQRLKVEIAKLIKQDRNILQTEIIKALPDDLKASKSTVHRIIKEMDFGRTKKYVVGRNLARPIH